jgi:hypothetical protein
MCVGEFFPQKQYTTLKPSIITPIPLFDKFIAAEAE